MGAPERLCIETDVHWSKEQDADSSLHVPEGHAGRGGAPCGAPGRGAGLGAPRAVALAGDLDALLAQLAERGGSLAQAVEPHRVQDLGRLHELDIAVLDDLDQVAPRVAEVEAAAGDDVRAGRLERRPHGV